MVNASPPASGLQPTAARLRRAFTLTEILVVIAIIAALSALASVAVVRALDTAKQTRIKTEVDALHAAFEAYKKKHGSYPPCDLRIDPAASPGQFGYNAPLRRHVAQAFPKYRPRGTLADDLLEAGVDTFHFRPDQALVFWLNGFNRDPAHPFDNVLDLDKSEKTAPFFDFDLARLSGQSWFRSEPQPARGRKMRSYFPPGVSFEADQPNLAPYLYFDSESYGKAPDIAMSIPAQPYAFNTSINTDSTKNLLGSYTLQTFPDAGAAAPYWLDANGNGRTEQPADNNEGWVNPDSFQIIAPGVDGKYGADAIIPRLYKTGTGYDLADEDNVTNFCPRPRLGDDKP